MKLPQRSSGVLVPVFSLRSAHDVGVGDFEAFERLFAWLQQASQRVLMVLPLLPTTPGDPSPYSTRSAFGLNPLFIHLGWLPEGVEFTKKEQAAIAEARASKSVRYDLVFPLKTAALERAFATFEQQGASERRAEFEKWCVTQADWLDGYALYSALSEHFGAKPWWEWPTGLSTREPKALAAASNQHKARVRFHQYLQWVAFEQWSRVRAQAKSYGIVDHVISHRGELVEPSKQPSMTL